MQNRREKEIWSDGAKKIWREIDVTTAVVYNIMNMSEIIVLKYLTRTSVALSDITSSEII